MDEDEQKRIFCKNFRRLVDASGKGRNEIAKDLRFGYSSLNSWYRGVSMPNAAKVQTIADYFGVGKSALLDDAPDEESYYNAASARLANELFRNPKYRALLDAARQVSDKDLEMVMQMLDRLKGGDGADE